MLRRIAVFSVIIFNIALIASCNRSGTPDQIAEAILKKMTLEEKIGQMMMVAVEYLERDDDVKTYFIGSMVHGSGYSPKPDSNSAALWANRIDSLQSQALKTRLGVPILFASDAVHGNAAVFGSVVFPHNIGMGCTNNPALVQSAAEITATEMRGSGLRWALAPTISVARDERWGRTYESYSESPELVSRMGDAAIIGFQGKTLSPTSVLACAKHYIGDGDTEGGQNEGNVKLDGKALRALHLPPFASAVKAGVGSIMVSLGSFNSEKIHGQKYLITTVLKGELKFGGIVVSDWAGIFQLSNDTLAAVEQAINAGLDVVMLPGKYKEFMAAMKFLALQGRIAPTRLDDAVRRILKAKVAMGLFESPMTDRKLTELVGSQAHRDAARTAVQESLVLVKNENSILPLSKTTARIFVAGKNANNLVNQCGGWTVNFEDFQKNLDSLAFASTVLRSIRRAVSANTTVNFSVDGVGAAGATVAVAVIGEMPYAESVGDRDSLMISEDDLAVIENLKAAKVPIVIVVISGRPLILGEALAKADALVLAWLPGTEGDGIADVLFGDAIPKGKLSHSYPRTMEQVPLNVGDSPYSPLFEFGFGLSYSK